MTHVPLIKQITRIFILRACKADVVRFSLITLDPGTALILWTITGGVDICAVPFSHIFLFISFPLVYFLIIIIPFRWLLESCHILFFLAVFLTEWAWATQDEISNKIIKIKIRILKIRMHNLVISIYASLSL